MVKLKKANSYIMQVLFAIVVCSIAVFAQTNKATLSGAVKDKQGAVVVGASVTATNTATGIARKATTNEDGFYQIPLLDAGTYRVSVTKDGFQTVKRENVVLQTSTETSADFELPTGQVSAEVTVTNEAPLIETEAGPRGAVITGREITELPLSGRNFTQLATLTPGVVRSTNVGVGGSPDGRSFNNGDPRAGNGGPGGGNPTGGSETSRFARSGGANISANGQRPTNNNFSLDGVDNNEPQYGTIGSFTNPDAIAEFKVTTSVPSADVGRAAGAVVTVTTKSGGNKYNGSLYFYGQNSALNAYHPSLKTRLAEAVASNSSAATINSLKKSTQQISEFGGTFGGPIIKDKTFFFFDYLGQRNNFPTDASTAVPTVGAKTGDFSQYPAGSFVNPFTGQPFAGNIVPANLFNTTGQNFLKSFPNPTLANINNPSDGNKNFFIQRKVQETINNYRIRLDHRISNNNSITGSFSDQKLFTLRDTFFGKTGPSAGFGAGEELGNTRTITINDVHTFSPTVINEFRFGYNSIQIGINNCGVGGACGNSETFASDLGIPNVNLGTYGTTGTPGIFVENWGNGNGNVEWVGDGGPFRTKSNNPYFADTLTIVRGNNTLKFGGELRLRQVETIDGGRLGFTKGVFVYGANEVAYAPNPACPTVSRRPNFGVAGNTDCYVNAAGVPFGGSGNGLVNILLGLPAAKIKKSGTTEPFNLRSNEVGLFITDDWKVNDRLSLTLGLRYDLFTPTSEKDGRWSLYDLATRKVLVASGSGDTLVKTDKNNFGPRVSFAYSLDKEKNMVLRGGYGISYTLDGTDIAPGIGNVPFSPRVEYDQIAWGGGSDGTNIYNGSFGLRNGPPTVAAGVNPTVLDPNSTVLTSDFEQKSAYVHQFNLGVQYQFAKDYSIDIGYVGNRSRNLLYTKNIGKAGTAEARNTAGGFINGGLVYTNGAKAQYDALQLQLKKRLSNGVEGQVSYTWGHSLDNSPGVFGGIGDARTSRNGQINPFNLNADWGNSGHDTRQLLSGNAVIDLPFGKGRKFLDQGGVTDVILGGWQMNWIVTGRTGYPFSVVTGENALQRPSLIGNPYANLGRGKLLNAAAFSNTAGITTLTNASGTDIKFGNLGRNTFRGPRLWFADMSLFKNFRVMEKYKLQFGIEFYNVFNRSNFTVPNNNISNGDFGEIRYNLAAGRVVQYRFKFNF